MGVKFQPLVKSGFTIEKNSVNISGDTMTGGLTIKPATDTLTALVVNDKDANRVLTVDTVNNSVGIGTTAPTSKITIIGNQLITSDDAATVPLVVKGAASQTANLQQWQNSTSTTIAKIDKDGYFSGSGLYAMGGSGGSWIQATGSGTIISHSSAGSATALTVKHSNGSTTGHLLDLQLAGTSKFIVDKNGNVGIGTTAPSQKLDVNGKIAVNGQTTIYNANALGDSTGSLYIGNGGNSAIGSSATYNTGVGIGTLQNNTTGYRNTALGWYSLSTNTEGYSNSAFGYTTLRNNTTGIQNAGLGYGTLFSNTSGNRNTGVGNYANYNSTTGSDNTSIGYYSLFSNKTGSNGVAIGVESQRYANDTTTPWTNANTSIGYQSLRGSITASENTGNSNTALGYQTLYNNTTGDNNAAIGRGSLFSNTTGYYNMAIGNFSLTSITSGHDNVALGNNAGRYYNGTTGNLTNSSNSIFLGASASALANGGTNEIVIGYDAIGLGSNTIKLGNTSITNVASNGDFEALDIGDGFILKSPDGTRYRITVANGGALSAVAV